MPLQQPLKCRFWRLAAFAPLAAMVAWPARADAPSLHISRDGGSVHLRLTANVPPGSHTVIVRYAAGNGRKALFTSRSRAEGKDGALEIIDHCRMDAGDYQISVELDGKPAGEGTLTVPGITRAGGELYVNGAPFSGVVWEYVPVGWRSKRENGRFAGVNAVNMLRPQSAGGYGFNVLLARSNVVKPADFAAMDAAGGHILVSTTAWEGLSPWGPKEWNVGTPVDPLIRSDGSTFTPTENGADSRHGSFDSPRNRATFVANLRRFKAVFGCPASLLGFYIFESTPDMPWDNKALYTDYSPASVARFHTWLAARYHTTTAYSKRHATSIHGWTDVSAPAAPNAADPLAWTDWIDFRYWDMADFLAWARGQARGIFGKDILFLSVEGLTSGYSSNDPSVPGSNSFYGVDERQRAKMADGIGVEATYDYAPNHTRIMRHAADRDGDGLPDTPVMMDFYNYSWQPKDIFGDPGDIPHLRQVDALAAGATGTVMEHTGMWIAAWDSGDARITADRVQGFNRIAAVNTFHARYAALFRKARTAADVHVVLPTWQFRYDHRYRKEARWWDQISASFQNALQRSQRQIGILYADEAIPKTATALMVPIGERTSPDFVHRLERAVENGANAYIEGVPKMDEDGRPIAFPLAKLVGGTPKAWKGESATPSILLPGGAAVPCEQPMTPEDKGSETLAAFTDGTPAVVLHHLGKGSVIYCPSLAGNMAADAGWKDALYQLNFPEPARQFYAAMAGHLSPPLLRVTGAASPKDIRLGLLTKDGSALLLATNWSDTPQDVEITVPAAYSAARDLRGSAWLSLNGESKERRFPLHLNARDWGAVALGTDRPSLTSVLDTPILHIQRLK